MAKGKQNDILNKDVFKGGSRQSTTDTISQSDYQNQQEKEDAIMFK